MTTLSIETCVSALSNAALSRKLALQIEIAVSFGIFTVAGNSDREARQTLCDAYATAGYQCLTADDIDYKTVNRRVNATADLFNAISLRTVRKWIGHNCEQSMLAAIVEGLRPYEIQSIADAQRYCLPPPAVNTDTSVPVAVKPHHSVLHIGQKKVLGLFQRGAVNIQTSHLMLTVPNDTNKAELLDMVAKILSMVEKMNVEIIH